MMNIGESKRRLIPLEVGTFTYVTKGLALWALDEEVLGSVTDKTNFRSELF